MAAGGGNEAGVFLNEAFDEGFKFQVASIKFGTKGSGPVFGCRGRF